MTSGGVLGGIIGDQTLSRIILWQIVGELLQGALEPYGRALEQLVNTGSPNQQLSPADLASLVVRTFEDEASAAPEAAMSGIDAARFHHLVQLAGLAIAPEQAAVALRRKIIPEDAGNADGVGFLQAIAQGNLANKWAPVIQALATEIPSPTLALVALLKGQTDDATARALYQQFGGDPEFFDLAFHTEGDGPSPVEAGTLANRGIIPWDGEGPEVTSFHQAFLESQYRPKWEASFKALAQYRIPPRSVTAMVRAGALTDDQATARYMDYGVTAEDAAALLHEAHKGKTEAAHTLARTTIEKLYEDKILTQQEATDALVAEGWSEHDAGYLLAVVDFARQQQAITSAIGRIKALYIGYKITADTVTRSLTTLGMPDAQQSDLVAIWNLERAANARELTPAQIENAAFYKVITVEEASDLLVRLGYTPHDAWIAISVRFHGPTGAEPSRTAVGLAPGIQS